MGTSRRVPAGGGAAGGSPADSEAASDGGEGPAGIPAHGRPTDACTDRRPSLLPRVVRGSAHTHARRAPAGGGSRPGAGPERCRCRRGAGGGAVARRVDRHADGGGRGRVVTVAAVVATHDACPGAHAAAGTPAGGRAVAAPAAQPRRG